MRGGPRVGEAAALVDGDIHENRAGAHAVDQLGGDQLRRGGAGDQHGADHEIGLDDGLLEREGRGVAGVHAAAELGVHGAHLAHVEVEDGDIGAHAGGDLRGVDPRDAAADHGDLRGRGAGHAAHEHAAPALRAHQVIAADLRSEAAGDLGHRGEKGERAVLELHRLVGDRRGPRGEQRVGAGPRGGEVQVCEDGLLGAHAAVLGLDRLLDLEEQLCVAPHLVGGVDDAGTGGGEVGIGDRGTEPRALLDQDVVSAAGQLGGAAGRDRHAVLVVLDLGGDSDAHRVLSCGGWGMACVTQCEETSEDHQQE